MQRALLAVAGIVFAGFGALAEAQTPVAPPPPHVVMTLAQHLARAPDNRALRFRYAQASYQTGRHDAAKYHLRVLMRSSDDPAELGQLRKAYGKVLAASPWSFSLNLSLLPSTNVNKVSSNTTFDTLLGQFMIVNGGQEESGIGLRFGGRLACATMLDNGLALTFSLAANRNWYPTQRFRRYDGEASATLGWQTVAGNSEAKPYVTRSFYDTEKTSNATRYGIRLSHEHYLSDSASLTGAFTAEYRDYDQADYLDGGFFRGELSYQGVIADTFKLNVAAKVEHSMPERDYLRYTGASLSGEVSRSIGLIGTLGLSADFGLRQYEGVFPALTEARRDQFGGVGVSFSSPHLKIWEMTPKLSCRYGQTWSNVALYEYQSTDCAISFERKF